MLNIVDESRIILQPLGDRVLEPKILHRVSVLLFLKKDFTTKSNRNITEDNLLNVRNQGPNLQAQFYAERLF